MNQTFVRTERRLTLVYGGNIYELPPNVTREDVLGEIRRSQFPISNANVVETWTDTTLLQRAIALDFNAGEQ